MSNEQDKKESKGEKAKLVAPVSDAELIASTTVQTVKLDAGQVTQLTTTEQPVLLNQGQLTQLLTTEQPVLLNQGQLTQLLNAIRPELFVPSPAATALLKAFTKLAHNDSEK